MSRDLLKKALLSVAYLVCSYNSYSIITELSVNKVMTLPSGLEEIVEDVENINPDDIIEYSFYIENDSLFSIYSLKPTIPVPKMTTLILKSVTPDQFKVSLDNVNFIDLPIYDIDNIEIPESAYKKVQWYIDEVESEESITLKLRVRIDE